MCGFRPCIASKSHTLFTFDQRPARTTGHRPQLSPQVMVTGEMTINPTGVCQVESPQNLIRA